MEFGIGWKDILDMEMGGKELMADRLLDEVRVRRDHMNGVWH